MEENAEIPTNDTGGTLIKTALRVVHLEDNRKDAELIQEALRNEGSGCQWVTDKSSRKLKVES